MADATLPLPPRVAHDVPIGTLVAVPLPVDPSDAQLAAWYDALPPEERSFARSLAAPRRVAFLGGRLALHDALRRCAPEHADTAILRDGRGAPQAPAGTLVSVSHKRRLAVGLALRASPATRDDASRDPSRLPIATVGVDLEERPTAADRTRPDLAPKICTARERHALTPLATRDDAAYRDAVRLHFALKEAVYKAIDPHVHRHVRFQEVEVVPHDDGTVAVRLLLPEFAGTGYAVRAWWQRLDDHLLAIAIGPPR